MSSMDKCCKNCIHGDPIYTKERGSHVLCQISVISYPTPQAETDCCEDWKPENENYIDNTPSLFDTILKLNIEGYGVQFNPVHNDSLHIKVSRMIDTESHRSLLVSKEFVRPLIPGNNFNDTGTITILNMMSKELDEQITLMEAV